MKLETAYRKLFRHRFRWEIDIRFDQDSRPAVNFKLRDLGQWPTDQGDSPREARYAMGLANAMSAAADRIVELNRVIDAYKSYRKIAREVSR